MNKLMRISIFAIYALFYIFFAFQPSYGQHDGFSSGCLPDRQSYIDSLPDLVLTPASLAITLPSEVDNSSLRYFPHKPQSPAEVFYYDQDPNHENGGSCVPVSMVWYTYTYEINRLKGTSANTLDSIYSPNFMWNFYNTGNFTIGMNPSGASTFMSKVGILDVARWGNYYAPDYLRWIDGYDNYYAAMKNKIESEYTSLELHDDTSVNTMKHYLYDHGTGSLTGGVSVIIVEHYTNPPAILVPPSAYAEDRMWHLQNISGAHSMTIVGYCDNVGWDFDTSGTIESNVGKPMSQWEWGAFRVVNSYGNWYNRGYVWIPYRHFAVNPCWTYQITPKSGDYPEIVLKIKASCEHRNNFKDQVLWDESACGQGKTSANAGKFFYDSGGDHPLSGSTNPTLEFGYDWGSLLGNKDYGKVINEIDMSSGDAELQEFSMIDYRWGETFELPYTGSLPVTISSSTQTFGIGYDLLPFVIDQDLTYPCSVVSRFDPMVTNNSTLTIGIGHGARIDMYNSTITIEQGSELILGDQVTIVGKTGDNEIIIDGDIQVGSNVNFITEPGATLKLITNSTCPDLTLNNAIFKQASLINNADNLSITNTTFNGTDDQLSYRGNVTITGCTFRDNGFFIQTPENDPGLIKTAIVTDCEFISSFTPFGRPAILISNYGNFFIENNIISAYSTGLWLSFAGVGQANRQLVNNNQISDCTTGIYIYYSTATLNLNQISDNGTGICFYDRSNAQLVGNQYAYYSSETQVIRDNVSYEIYASNESFPNPCNWNVIKDEDNQGNDPLVYADYLTGSTNIVADHNCWGTNFNPVDDLYPSSLFIYTPTWCPPGGKSQLSYEEEEALFNSAMDKFESGDYSDAKLLFESVIQQYPKSVFAQKSMKELYRIEQFASNDYNQLKTYFTTNDSILADTILTALGNFLANSCDVRLENWSAAISFQENRILNPVSFQDSIFGIIDLGYTYLMMENRGSKFYYVGKLPGYKPNSLLEYQVKSDQLLKLLPEEDGDNSLKKNLDNLDNDKLLYNVPNPFSGVTTIYYKLSQPSNVVIKIFDITGQEKMKIVQSNMAEGVQKIELNAMGLTAGLYTYILEVDGRRTDAKKMVIVK